MSDIHEALKKKFAPLASTSTVVQLPPPAAKAPSKKRKGDRERIAIRLHRDLIRDLRALKLALGTDVNDLVEKMIVNGVAEKVADVKKSNPGEWDVIRRCANER